MNILILAFLFSIGSILGWFLELIYRRFISNANPDRKWINPGFLVGPYLPLYGFSLCALYLLASIKVNFIQNEVLQNIVLFMIMAVVVTVIEFIAGVIFIRRMKVKLWDYTSEWANFKGIICPKYTLYWSLLSAVYYFMIHSNLVQFINFMLNRLEFSFFIGFFYGVIAMDLCYSINIVSRISMFAKDNNIIVRYEALKEAIRKKNEEEKEKRRFVFSMKSDTVSFTEQLKNYAIKEQEKIKGVVLKNLHETAKKFKNNKDS